MFVLFMGNKKNVDDSKKAGRMAGSNLVLWSWLNVAVRNADMNICKVVRAGSVGNDWSAKPSVLVLIFRSVFEIRIKPSLNLIFTIAFDLNSVAV